MSACPRCCRGRLVGREGERACLACGFEAAGPARPRAGDAVEEPRPVRRRDLARATGTAWSAADRAFLERNLGRLTIDQIARELGRTRAGVQMYLWKRLGIRKPRVSSGVNVTSPASPGAGKRWARHELEWLLDHARPGVLAKLPHFRRSYWGAYQRLRREGVRLREADGLVSVHEASRVMDMPAETLRRWVVEGRVPAERPAGSREWRLGFEEALRAAELWRRGERPPRGGS